MAKIIIILGLYASIWVHAGVYSPSGHEVYFEVEARFQFAPSGGEIWSDKASDHVSYLFGVLQSPSMVTRFGLAASLVGGIGAMQMPVSLTRLEDRRNPQGLREVTYRAEGKMLLHRSVAKDLLAKGYLEVPLPYDFDNFYDPKCTDSYYQSIEDFWYFHDVFRVGCEYLKRTPFAKMARIKFLRSTATPQDLRLHLDKVRGPNSNGPLFRIDVIHGFAESSIESADEGRKEFEKFHSYLKHQGFTAKLLRRHSNRPLWLFTKEVVINGKIVEIEVRNLLVNSDYDSKSVTFAKFFREAVEQADIVYYAGHSGLGSNLDLSLLEEKAGGFEFNTRKKQIFFFDSCASYSYYLYGFRSEKTLKSIDIVTNALASYFATGATILEVFMSHILDTRVEDKSWDQVLGDIEYRLGGATYLINVGGLN